MLTFVLLRMEVSKSWMIYLKVWWFIKKLSKCQLYERRFVLFVNLGVQVHFREEKQK